MKSTVDENSRKLANKRLIELYERQQAGDDVRIAYWNSDAWGRSANDGLTDNRWHAKPGVVQEIDEDLDLAICPWKGRQGGLHATTEPHRWQGVRVWIVALFGEVKEDGDKLCARKREIICEIAPDCLLSPQIAARMGVGLGDLEGASLRFATLRGANLYDANLRGANFLGANLYNANLHHADLRGANLRGADLRCAYLRDADLRGADLYGADLYDANLYDANLRGANLRFANLPRAQAAGARDNEHTIYPWS